MRNKMKSASGGKKKTTLLAIPLVTATIIGLGACGISTAYAEDGNGLHRFVERFKLTDEEREEHQAEKKVNFNESITNAVENGELTQEQKEIIEAKHEEMQAKRDNARELEPEERRDAMHEIRDEMRNWVEEKGFEDVIPKPELNKRGGGMGPGF